MRKLYLLAGLAFAGLGLAGWATLSTAQPIEPSPDRSPVAPQRIELPEGKPISQPVPRGAEPARLPQQPTDPDSPMLLPIQPPGSARPTPGAGAPQAGPERRAPGALVPMTPPAPTAPAAAPTGQNEGPAEPGLKSDTVRVGDDPAKPAGPIGALPGTRQDPAVSLEWHGPSAAKVGHPAEYCLMVRNACPIALQKVVVQVRVPEGLKVLTSEPRAETTEGVLVWELGTLAAKQEKGLFLKLVSSGRGDMACQAWVTFTGSTVMHMQVREPKLAVKAVAPPRVMVGDTADFVFTVTNPGDYPAERARITVTLPEGLESARGNKLSYELGNVQPGETRTLQVPCIARAGGEQRCEAVVEGDAGLKATDSAAVAVAQAKLELDVQGPKMRYLERRAVYSFKVSNPGDAPAANVSVVEALPPGFKFVAADAGGQLDPSGNAVKWFVGDIGPGQSRELKLEVVAAAAGEHTHKVIVSGARGARAERELTTRVEGLSAILMELVDTDDPVEVNADTAYEIRITNTGSKTESDLRLACTVPQQMEFKSATGPVNYRQNGAEIVFEPLAQLAPRADVVFKVVVKAKAKGDARFRAQLTTGTLVEPVMKIESTRVYDD